MDLSDVSIIIILAAVVGAIILFFRISASNKRKLAISERQNLRGRLIAEAPTRSDQELVAIAKSFLNPEEALLLDVPLLVATLGVLIKGGAAGDVSQLLTKACTKYPNQSAILDLEVDFLVARRVTGAKAMDKMLVASQRRPNQTQWAERYVELAISNSAVSATALKVISDFQKLTGSIKSLVYLADVYDKKKLYNDQTRLIFENIASREPNSAKWQYALARCKQNIGEIDAAQEALNKCLELAPSYPGAINLRGMLDDAKNPVGVFGSNDGSVSNSASSPTEISLPPRYTDISELGRGGMGIVFKAFDDVLKRWVAIKVLNDSFSQENNEIQERFLRESRIMANLDHPTIPKVFDVSVQPPCFISLEFVEGVNLREFLVSKGPFQLPEGLQIGCDLADGFQHASDREILHRDIKPENIILEKSGKARILDFGLARIEGQQNLTQAGTVVGTPWYLAPERLKGQPSTVSSEIYAFGITLYEMFTKNRPYLGDDLHVIFVQDPKPLRELLPNCPTQLDVLILDCINKNPVNRPPSFAEIRDELKRISAKII